MSKRNLKREPEVAAVENIIHRQKKERDGARGVERERPLEQQQERDKIRRKTKTKNLGKKRIKINKIKTNNDHLP